MLNSLPSSILNTASLPQFINAYSPIVAFFAASYRNLFQRGKIEESVCLNNYYGIRNNDLFAKELFARLPLLW